MGDPVLEIAGHRGVLRVGYQVAAELGPWRLVLAPRLPRSYALEAHVAQASDYWLAERPLALTLEVGADAWVWPAVEPTIDGAQLRLTVGGMPTILRGMAAREERQA